MKTAAFFAVSAFLLSCAPVPVSSLAPQGSQPTIAAELLAAIDSVALAAVEGGEVAGISVAVWSSGLPVHSRGYGVAALEEGTQATDSTMFRIGSIAKQITAAAVLRLEEEGRLSVHDPISRHMDDAPAHWKGVTIHHLLNHTSGIPSYTNLPEFWQRATEHVPLHERIGTVRDLPLEFEPGTRWSYNNSGYLLLGSIIEKVSGREYGLYVEQEIVAPLGLRETGACIEEDPRMARGYRRGPEGFVQAASNQLGGTFADGDLCSSARDLLRWTTALASGKVISAESYRRMLTRGRLLDGREIFYGYGFDLLHLDGVGAIAEHGGGVPGFRSHLAYYPEQDVVIVVLTNTFGPTAQTAKKAIERRLFAELLPAVLDLDLPAERIATYEGTYDVYLPAADLGPFPTRIFGADGRLMMEADGVAVPLLWQGGHEFIDGGGAGLRLIFEVVDGRTVKLVGERSGLHFEGLPVSEAAGS